MYFQCKSCGSNEYLTEGNQIRCSYCGSSYFYQEASSIKQPKNRNLIWISVLAGVLGVAIWSAIPGKKVQENERETSHTRHIATDVQAPAIAINNTNAQIGTQIVHIGDKPPQGTYKVSGEVVHHTPVKNDRYTDKSIGYFIDEKGNKHTAIMLPRPKVHVDAKGNVLIDNKSKNLKEQKIEKYIDENGLRTVVVTTSGFNRQENRVYLDKKGIVPLIASSELPGKIISSVVLSKDAKTLFYVSRYDFLYIADIGELHQPRVMSKIELVNITDVLLSQDEKRLFVNSRDELAIFDISDLKNPRKLGSISSKDFYKGMALSPREDRLFIVGAKSYDTLWVVDITDLHHLKIERKLTVGGRLWNITRHRGRIYAQNSVIDPVTLKVSKFDTPYSAGFDFFGDYIVAQSPFNELALLKNEDGKITKLNQLNAEGAWHAFYQRIRDVHFTKDGQYITMIVGKNSISFKRFRVLLPSFMVDEESLYDMNDYFTKQYSAVVQPEIDEVKKLLLSDDGTKLFAFSSSDMFVYDISKL